MEEYGGISYEELLFSIITCYFNIDFKFLWKSLVDSLHKILEQSAMCACVLQIVLEYVLMNHLMHESVINLFHSHIGGLTIDDDSVAQPTADIHFDPFAVKQTYIGSATFAHNEFHRLEFVSLPNSCVG